ncbi:hypothetical protein JOF56_009270 [Kibdelosporangium banguiense]|uniref:Uncharacterized protein n=1 Tax=Kibdelosporangium banguiense TaxID=1365924 RepID=A0ABS4TWW2_9PSEU|nr:hypothetical protein [Kibdelosporangium banguiense]MBP2328885.1 hypothetical protein [Kibdelosporangium banguiense]
MSNGSAKRVQYQDHQILRLQDFTDEQDYHVAMRRRHNLSGHAWGIASGLDVILDNGNLFVQPGFAVDGYGRELVLATRIQVSSIELRTDGQFTYDLYLCYREKSTDPAQAAFDATKRDTRWTEHPDIFVNDVPQPSVAQDPDHPPTVPACDWSFDATRPPPPADKPWPVFLARITTHPTDPPSFTVDSGHRRYVRVIAARVENPRKTTVVNVGLKQFSVEVGKSRTKKTKVFTASAEGVAVTDGLKVAGGLTIDSGPLQFAKPAGTPIPSDAQPWRMYRAETGYRELRVELPAEEDGDGPNTLAIGAWSQQEQKFLPCLTVASDHTVTVDGTLVVRGTIDGVPGGGAAQDENLPLAMAALLAAADDTLAAMAIGLVQNYPETAKTLAGKLSAPVLAAGLAQNPAAVSEFADELVRNHPAVVQALRVALNRET